MNFYAVIIGTEILNARRKDAHFDFLVKELAKYGHELFASFIVKDDSELMKRTYRMILEDKDAVMFSFGGIGSTPDDLTREIAAEIFTDATVEAHPNFLADIIERFGEKAYPHRIHMADLPPNADLIHNPVNNMSGFSLENRYFFTPGFPSMSHPMIADVIKKQFGNIVKKTRLTLYAHVSEEQLITRMQELPRTIELSCLPLFVDGKPHVELSLSGSDSKEVKKYFSLFRKDLEREKIYYRLL